MVRIISLIALLSIFASCHDMAKNKQLRHLKSLENRVATLQRNFEILKKDTIAEIIYAMNDVNNKIKRTIGDDTLTVSQVKALNNYKKIYRKLESIEGYSDKFLFASQNELNALDALKTDIQKAKGEREKYDENILKENRKVNKLEDLYQFVEKLQKESVIAYFLVNEEVVDIIKALEEKNN